MNRNFLNRLVLAIGATVGVASLVIAPASALTTKATASTTSTTEASQARLQLIINRGNNEISRRLTTLNTLDSKINAAAKLSADDKSTLSTEVNNEIGSLTSLKTQLDGETTVAAAVNDAQSVITDYRVYALIVPKVELVKTADDQQVAESKLTDLAGKLQTRITSAKSSGKQVTALQSSLDDLNSKVAAAQTISSSIESGVIGLQPSDYNSDHSVLSGDRDQLKTAQNDIQAAVSDAKSIVTGLKNL